MFPCRGKHVYVQKILTYWYFGVSFYLRLAGKELDDVVLIDILEDVSAGKALDFLEAAPIEKHDSRIIGASGD